MGLMRLWKQTAVHMKLLSGRRRHDNTNTMGAARTTENAWHEPSDDDDDGSFSTLARAEQRMPQPSLVANFSVVVSSSRAIILKISLSQAPAEPAKTAIRSCCLILVHSLVRRPARNHHHHHRHHQAHTHAFQQRPNSAAKNRGRRDGGRLVGWWCVGCGWLG